jgi:hypothetical protein
LDLVLPIVLLLASVSPTQQSCKKETDFRAEKGQRTTSQPGMAQVAKKKLISGLRNGLRKGKGKKVNLGWHNDRKENPISAPSIHVGALVGASSL